MRQGGLVVMVLAVLLAGCADSSSGTDSRGSEESESEQSESDDYESSLACDHFRNVARDIADGVLTDAEAREKLKEVHENAIIATPAVRSAARGMLAAMTAGDYEALAEEVANMDQACTDAGS